MNTDALETYPNHKLKREAVKQAILALDGVSLNFWRYVEGESQYNLHKQMLHLRALREEVITSANTLLEVDATLVNCKAAADNALNAALQPEADQEQKAVLEPHQSPILLHSGTIALFNALKLGATEANAQAWTRMSRDWKMLLYSVRCLQDCIYGALLLIQSQPIGAYASMATCLKLDKKGNPKPNSIMLDTRAPGYCEWFMRMKEIRDELKRGLSVTSSWDAGEHSILLSELYPDGNFVANKNVRRLSLDFAAECVAMCTAAINAVYAELAEISQRE
jgi:hypothetical protein